MRKMLAVATLCGAVAFLHSGDAGAQCAARDVLQKVTIAKSTLAPATSTETVHGVWKTITLGRFANTFALRNVLDAAGCGVGDLAGEVLARPTFVLSPVELSLDLVVVSATELGMAGETSLADVYTRAQERGLAPAPAEVGPQLRLQYFDQPIGEFLHIGMTPMKTWSGTPVTLVLVNGGAGLILIGQDSSANTKISATSRFVFVRPHVLAKDH